MVLIAALSIAWVAVGRLIHPAGLEHVGIGLAVSAGASVINLVVGVALRRAGRRHRSLTLDADGRHLLPDVWTSVGVLAGVGAVALTGWERLDPLIALAVAVNIVVTGVALVRRATGGLLDRALPDAERVLDEFGAETALSRAAHPPGGPALLRFGARLPAGGASSAAMTCSNGSKPPSAPCCPALSSSRTASRSKTPLRRRTPGSTAPTGPTWPVSQLSGPLRDPRRDRVRACEPRLSRFSVEASLGQWSPPLEGCFPTEPLPDVDSLASCKSSSKLPPGDVDRPLGHRDRRWRAFDLERADPPAPDGAPP